MGKAIVRLKDIADETGFSTNTVSLALRNSPRIPETTRKTIQAAAQKLNYLPNAIAKSLVSRQTMTIGLVLTQITNPALTETAQALELALGKLGYGTLFATSNNTLEDEIRVLELFRSRQVDGMLIYPTSPQQLDHIRPLRAANYPVVLLINDPAGTIDSVSMDDRHGAERATAHLIAQGHRRIGILDSATHNRNRNKQDGYRDALEAHGITFDPGLCAPPTGPTSQDGYVAMDRLMQTKNPPTAIFTVTDTLAFGVMKWALEKGLDVPDDLAIIGFDDIEFAEFSAIPLSSIAYAAETVADKAIARLMTLIQSGETLPPPEQTLIDPDLVIRQSTVAS